MSEVKVFKCVGYMERRSRAGGERWVSVDDFDRVTAERDALQQRLTAADERVDVMTTALSRIQFRCQSFVESDWAMAVESVEAVLSIAEAALKPVEGGGDEPNCLLCLDKKTVPSNLAKGYVMDCPDCCGEEG